MNLLYCLVFCSTIVLIQISYVECTCEPMPGYSGVISYKTDYENKKCWYINPSEESLIYIKFIQLEIQNSYCDFANIKLKDNYGKSILICPGDVSSYPNKTLTFKGTLNIYLYLKDYWDHVLFSLEFNTETVICFKEDHFRCSKRQCIFSKQVCDGVEDCENGLDEKNCENDICAEKDHFRCSLRQCIFPNQVCDGVEDCENGLDEKNCGILENNDTRVSRRNAINWLKNRHTNFGWGKNTHRAVTALYLTDAAKYRGDAEEEMFIKQLQLKTASSLLRNLTEPMSINELSMYINALLVTCHNVRNIFSEDLLNILADRAFSNPTTSPGAYLTLCNANWPLSEKNAYQLLNVLKKDIDYPFAIEIQGMTIMALSCLRQKHFSIRNSYNITSIYNKTIENFISSQKVDGRFGNAHTTALVMQALISSSQFDNTVWNEYKALEFLMESLNTTSVDFLSVYLTLPLFKGKTLMDIGNVDCTDYERKLEEDDDILDVVDKLGAKIHVEYFLCIGDNKNVLRNIYLKVPENSTVLDVMKIAQIADPEYRFSFHNTNGHMYVYEVAGLSNDMEAGKFWMFYTATDSNSTLEHFTESPDKIIMEDQEHLVLWYKTANF